MRRSCAARGCWRRVELRLEGSGPNARGARRPRRNSSHTALRATSPPAHVPGRPRCAVRAPRAAVGGGLNCAFRGVGPNARGLPVRQSKLDTIGLNCSLAGPRHARLCATTLNTTTGCDRQPHPPSMPNSGSAAPEDAGADDGGGRGGGSGRGVGSGDGVGRGAGLPCGAGACGGAAGRCGAGECLRSGADRCGVAPRRGLAAGRCRCTADRCGCARGRRAAAGRSRGRVARRRRDRIRSADERRRDPAASLRGRTPRAGPRPRVGAPAALRPVPRPLHRRRRRERHGAVVGELRRSARQPWPRHDQCQRTGAPDGPPDVAPSHSPPHATP